MHKIGIKIHLHAFEYGRPHREELNPICSSVNYYPRDTTIISHITLIPYSVLSRQSDRLLKNLLKDNYPILFDGIQTTLYLDHRNLSGRCKYVRIHNIENLYYLTLARIEKRAVNRLYYHLESFRLKRYEGILEKADKLITVSEVDQEYYNSKFNNSILIPSFHPFNQVKCRKGTGEYLLYHGDLSVNENVAVSEHLIAKVFSKVPFRCVIAGKNPPAHLAVKTLPFDNITLISNPDNENMARIIRDAHVNILPTMAVNGLKLKLLMSLFSGRHCVVNNTTIKGSGLGELCQIADTSEEMIRKIHYLMELPFTEEMIADRKRVLLKNNDNLINAQKLSRLIFPA